ncbi:MAG: hypothetical protein A2W23_02600 [Planctomycetes bacterium RBG_16_43_13]|nr:MAG: hypothetical protein A2W23_02600 [Planctomycetes bacterium RBG_16_43_13]
MAQIKIFNWTNPDPAVARNLDCGFQPVEVTTVDVTNGGSFYWIDGMGDGYYLDVDSGAITAANGMTPLAQSTLYGPAITGFTNANPGVITASNIAQCGVVAGDTISVSGVADDNTATSLNRSYVVASVTATTITTDINTSAYSVYVSGGIVKRVTDTAGDEIPTENYAIQGVTIGTGSVGAASAAMVAIVKGDNPVD